MMEALYLLEPYVGQSHVTHGEEDRYPEGKEGTDRIRVMTTPICPRLWWKAFIWGHKGFKIYRFYYQFWLMSLCNIKILFLEIGEERERERGRETWRFAQPQPGTWPAIQAHALTGNWTSNLLVCTPAFTPLSHTSQGESLQFGPAL